ncbi:hypothetical protein E6O75_ATG08604 [Venturia nashicola]|uniref:Uncharacterized protein n=1 Tax=Venturia nashicola TaxID=86259 RepID=A0A4Z1NKX0_9PEZI|nr:hypothetical protein E6O75_ATG08604 [Venturia nashicola]
MTSRSPPSFHPPCREDRAAVSPNTNHTGRQFNEAVKVMVLMTSFAEDLNDIPKSGYGACHQHAGPANADASRKQLLFVSKGTLTSFKAGYRNVPFVQSSSNSYLIRDV